MSLSVALLIWLFLAGAVALVALAWATLAAFAGDTRWLARVLLLATGCLALWPGTLSRWSDGATPYGVPLLAGTGLILGGALVCLARLRRREEARLPAGIAALAAVHYLLVLAAAVFWPG